MGAVFGVAIDPGGGRADDQHDRERGESGRHDLSVGCCPRIGFGARA